MAYGHRRTSFLALCGMCAIAAAPSLLAASDVDLSDPARLSPPPPPAAGFPIRDGTADVRQGFLNPPAGYGEVPFYWWVGDPLTRERLTWQLDELKAKGVTGLQINYPHQWGGGGGFGMTYPSDPPLFSEPWWDLWQWIVGESRKRQMAVGISDYTLAWPGNRQWVDEIMADPNLRGANLDHKTVDAAGGTSVSLDVPDNTLSVMAYRIRDGTLDEQTAVDLCPKLTGRHLDWQTPDGKWKIVSVFYRVVQRSINPMHPQVGRKVVEKHFQRFEDHSPGEGGKGLNYFFQDELMFGIGGLLWSDNLAEAFRSRKGYDLAPVLPALFHDIGPRTPKIRMDYSDVMVGLSEEGYFRPVFQWHWDRGMLYGCDQCSRGTDPHEYGDYFRCVRWFTAPGHDTPGVGADLIKGKVSSSIAHLYQRPRVWLEGYHSAGWGMAPAAMTTATCENYIFGCSLLTLHGLYYTTHGGWWEWAPPCYHFRMPYWDHMGYWLKYFERLSYLLSQGVHRCDVAVMYPVAPIEAGMSGQEAVAAAFGVGRELFKNGIDFDFMDFQSLARADIKDKQLCVSGESYRMLVLPGMAAVRRSTLQQAMNFFRSGGLVVACGCLPEADDAAGRQNPELDGMVKGLFGLTAREARDGKDASPQTNTAGGIGMFVRKVGQAREAVDRHVARDFIPWDSENPAKPGSGYVLHRKIGPRDVYMVMNVPKDSECTFSASGKPELWDPWTGQAVPIHTFSPTPQGTRVRLPLEAYEARIIVFSPGELDAAVEKTDLDAVDAVEQTNKGVTVKGFARTGGKRYASVRQGDKVVRIEGTAPAPPAPLVLDGAWEFELKPTMDNRWGDFRQPAGGTLIGAEARQFRYAEETSPSDNWQTAHFDDSQWTKTTCSYGPRFWRIGPLPANGDTGAVEARLLASNTLDPASAVSLGNQQYPWTKTDFSLRWGVEGKPADQGGPHGLKEIVGDEFIDLTSDKAGAVWYLWTTLSFAHDAELPLKLGGTAPVKAWLNGKELAGDSPVVRFRKGANTMLLRLVQQKGKPLRAYAVPALVDANAKPRSLALRWFTEPTPFVYDIYPAEAKHVGWYRFTAPPGLRGMRLVAHGKVRAWANGQELMVSAGEGGSDGATRYAATIATPSPTTVPVAIRIEQTPGYYAGAAIPEPIALDCVPGQAPLGDWSNLGVLAAYSGGAWYRKMITVTPQQATGRVILQLGKVAATAEIRVNGQVAGIRVAPPWSVDVSRFIKAGENRVEVLVYNTLANHYSVGIPTHYLAAGQTVSGLLGPVQIETWSPVVLEAGSAASK